MGWGSGGEELISRPEGGKNDVWSLRDEREKKTSGQVENKSKIEANMWSFSRRNGTGLVKPATVLTNLTVSTYIFFLNDTILRHI